MGFPTCILAAIDFSEGGEQAANEALAWAKASGATLHLCHVAETLPPTTRPSALPLLTGYVEQAHQKAREKLQELATRASQQGVEAQCHVVNGKVGAALSQLAEELAVDLAVVGTHGHSGLQRLVLGSTARDLVRELGCSVLAVRGDRSSARPKVVVLGDLLEEGASPARERALALCRESGATLHIVNSIDLGISYLSTVEVAVPTHEFTEAFAEAERRLAAIAQAASGVDVQTHRASERPADAICGIADEHQAELVVIGHASHNALERVLLGSVAERVVARAPCSVLVVR